MLTDDRATLIGLMHRHSQYCQDWQLLHQQRAQASDKTQPGRASRN